MKKWDVFISHASEDKQTVAIPLAEALRRGGLHVWLDERELRVGDSLREKIDDGLAQSRFGVVVISRSFLQKQWPKRELNGLMALEEDGQKVILPVWHDITKVELSDHSPILADRLATNTSEGIAKAARAIMDVVLSPESRSPSVVSPTRGRRLAALLDRNATVAEILDFLSAHPAIIQHAMSFTPIPGDIVIPNIKFQEMLIPFTILETSPIMIRTHPGITFVAFSDPTGPLLDEGQLSPDIAAQINSMRRMLDRLTQCPLTVIQPEWETQYLEAHPWLTSSQTTLADAWRTSFSNATVFTRDQLSTSRRLARYKDIEFDPALLDTERRKVTYLGEAILFARRRGERSETERIYLSEMPEDVKIHSYDRLLEAALTLDVVSNRFKDHL
jgi:hypothetical protein